MPKKVTYPDRQDAHDDALARLREGVTMPGIFKVITADHACPGGPQPKTGEQIAACRAHHGSDGPLPPSHYILHDVTALDGPDDRGRVVAHTAEGDWTMGYPADLLRRLLEHWHGG